MSTTAHRKGRLAAIATGSTIPHIVAALHIRTRRLLRSTGVPLAATPCPTDKRMHARTKDNAAASNRRARWIEAALADSSRGQATERVVVIRERATEAAIVAAAAAAAAEIIL